MKKLMVVILAVLTAAVIFTGCGNKERKAEGDRSVASAAEPGASAKTGQSQGVEGKKDTGEFPIIVKDANGFELTIDKKPGKIVSLSLGTDELLLDLIDKSRITAVTDFSVDPGVSNVADIAKDIPNKITANAEKIISLQPDLVIVTSWHEKDFIQQLRDAQITVYAYATPSNIEDQKKMVMEIARLVGEDARGKEIVGWMDKVLKGVEDRIKTLKPEERLTVLDYSMFGSTSGKGTNFDDIVARAGLINVASKEGLEGWPQISKEKIVEWNPDIIVLPSWSYDKKQDPVTFAEEIKKDKSLKEIKAVKNNRVYLLPYAHMSSISQYVVLAVEDTAKAAYPELFK